MALAKILAVFAATLLVGSNAAVVVKDDDASSGAASGVIPYPGEFPSQAAVAKTQSGDILGSGVLLSPSFILTSASTLQDGETALTEVFVLLGALSVTSSSKWLKSKNLVRHEDWSRGAAENDLALIQLEAPVITSDVIAPIRLPSRYYRDATYVGQPLSVVSWGASDATDAGKWLRAYNVNVIRNKDCQSLQSDPTRKLPWTVLCATSLEDSSLPGKGDNGGAVVFLEPDTEFTLVGILSNDLQGAVERPSTVARITEYLDWIAQNSDAKIDD